MIPARGQHRVAKRTIQMLIDDISGGDADETVRFAVDGTNYEIDLSAENATKFREALAPFVSHGTRLGRGSVVPRQGGAPRSMQPAGQNKEMNAAIRLWAQSSPWCKEKGYEVSDRGRIRAEVADAYPSRLQLDAEAKQRADAKAAEEEAAKPAPKKAAAKPTNDEPKDLPAAGAAVPAARRGRRSSAKAAPADA